MQSVAPSSAKPQILGEEMGKHSEAASSGGGMAGGSALKSPVSSLSSWSALVKARAGRPTVFVFQSFHNSDSEGEDDETADASVASRTRQKTGGDGAVKTGALEGDAMSLSAEAFDLEQPHDQAAEMVQSQSVVVSFDSDCPA